MFGRYVGTGHLRRLTPLGTDVEHTEDEDESSSDDTDVDQNE